MNEYEAASMLCLAPCPILVHVTRALWFFGMDPAESLRFESFLLWTKWQSRDCQDVPTLVAAEESTIPHSRSVIAQLCCVYISSLTAVTVSTLKIVCFKIYGHWLQFFLGHAPGRHMYLRSSKREQCIPLSYLPFIHIDGSCLNSKSQLLIFHLRVLSHWVISNPQHSPNTTTTSANVQ